MTQSLEHSSFRKQPPAPSHPTKVKWIYTLEEQSDRKHSASLAVFQAEQVIKQNSPTMTLNTRRFDENVKQGDCKYTTFEIACFVHQLLVDSGYYRN